MRINDRYRLVLAPVGSGLGGGGIPLPLFSTFSETFDGPVLDPIWVTTYWNDAAYATTITEGLAVLHALTASSYSWLVNDTIYNLENDSVYFRFSLALDANSQGTAYFTITEDVGVYSTFTMIEFQGANNRFSLITDAGNSAYVTYDATQHRYLRIRESGGTTYIDKSSDGTNWTNGIASVASSATPSGYIEAWVQNNSGFYDYSYFYIDAINGPATAPMGSSDPTATIDTGSNPFVITIATNLNYTTWFSTNFAATASTAKLLVAHTQSLSENITPNTVSETVDEFALKTGLLPSENTESYTTNSLDDTVFTLTLI